MLWVAAKGQTIEQMRENVRADPVGQKIIARGDTILAWVNEGDIIMAGMIDIGEAIDAGLCRIKPEDAEYDDGGGAVFGAVFP